MDSSNAAPAAAAGGPAAATPSTSSSSSGSTIIAGRKSDAGLADRRTHSGEIPLDPSDSKPSKPGHRRSGSGALFYKNASATSSAAGILPAGNICPSGKVGRSRSSSTSRSDVLGSGSGNYGHGSVVRGGSGGGGGCGAGAHGSDRTAVSSDPEEIKRMGNEQYRRGQFGEALRIYDRAILMCPKNAAYRTNRAAALVGLKRLGEAVNDCLEALKIDPGFERAHQRLASLYLRLGQVENAVRHVFLAGPQPDAAELQKIQAVEKHLASCVDARRIGDWKGALRETNAAIVSGADSSPLLIASRAEAFLRLHHLDEADSAISSAVKLES